MKRLHVTHACEKCRRLKRKCDGTSPCFSCKESSTRCVYDLEDKRSRINRASADTIASLQIQKQVLDHIWQAVLRGEEQSILNRIRSGASLSDIAHEAIGIELPARLVANALDTFASFKSVGADPFKVVTREDHRLDQNAFPQELPHAQASTGPRVTLINTASDHPDQGQNVSSTGQQCQQMNFGKDDPATEVSDYERRLLWHPSLQIPKGEVVSRESSSLSNAGSKAISLPQHSSTADSPGFLLPDQETREQTAPERLSSTAYKIAPTDHRIVRFQRQSQAFPDLGGPYLSPGCARSFGNLPFSSAVTANHLPSHQQQTQLQIFRRPEWQIYPHSAIDESPLGRVYTDFRNVCKTGASASVHVSGLVDATLFFRNRRACDHYSADTWACELQRSFYGHLSTGAHLAGVYVHSLFMRWLLNPTPATYAACPAGIRPTLQQRLTLHPSPIDLVAMLPLKDALMEQMRDYVSAITSAGLDINWLYSINEALICVRPERGHSSGRDDKIFISPQFAEQVRDPANWILGRKILTEFPEMVGGETTIHEEEVVCPVDRWL